MSAPRGLPSSSSRSSFRRPSSGCRLARHADASVAWPVSTACLAEALTGGVSASDEYVGSTTPRRRDRSGGCELVYVTAPCDDDAQAAFDSPLTLVPGAHLLVANSAGAYAPLADASYIGASPRWGIAALRHVGER